MINLTEIQTRQAIWSDHNFPNTPAHRPLLGLTEEVGELAHAHLKAEQGIRGTVEEHYAAKKDAVGDIIIYLADYCNKNRISMYDSYCLAWNEIKNRDWQKFPKNGKTE